MKHITLAHSFYRKPRGVCPECEKELALTQDERIPAHDAAREHRDDTGYCRGWGARPKDDIVYVPRQGGPR